MNKGLNAFQKQKYQNLTFYRHKVINQMNWEGLMRFIGTLAIHSR